MNAAWDGLPLNPERDGWHWVEHIETREASAWLWRAGLDDWVGMEPSEWRYLGPCLTPVDIARKDAALRAAYDHIAAPSRMQKDGNHTVCTYRMGPGRYNEITSMLRGAIPGERGA